MEYSTYGRQAIADAIDIGKYDFGGFYKEYGVGSPKFSFRDDIVVVGTLQCLIGSVDRVIREYPFDLVFSDPDFWQALGRAGKWDTTKAEYGKECMHCQGIGWRWHQHRFLDYLQDGKTAEDFFRDLYKGIDLSK